MVATLLYVDVRIYWLQFIVEVINVFWVIG
jgi:hypothetical protein